MSNNRTIWTRNKLKESAFHIISSSEFEDIFAEIENCQTMIDVLSEEEVSDKLTVSAKYDPLKKPLFDQRSQFIERIPRFWITAVENHPHLSQMLEDNEAWDMFQYITKMKIDLIKGGHLKLVLFFQDNPYIENQVLVKEFSVGDVEENMSITPAIVWKKGSRSDQEKPSGSLKRKFKDEYHFFEWFAEKSANDDFTSTQFYSMWENPMFFYLNGKLNDSDEEEGMDLDDIDTDNSSDN